MSNNNKTIVFASILGAILTTGLLALNPSTMIRNADAQMYEDQYGYDNYNYNDYYPEPKSSHTDIQKINCVNSNINVNGIDFTQSHEDGTATAAANEGTAVDAANTQNGNGLNKINFDRNLVNICANVNANEQVKISAPITTLAVTKTITCLPGDGPTIEACQRIQTEISPDEFQILVTGNNNPNPDTFPGSTVPVIVTLRPGDYVISETIDASVEQTIMNIENDLGVKTKGPFLIPLDTSDCNQGLSETVRGTIGEGESQTCDLGNRFLVGERG